MIFKIIFISIFSILLLYSFVRPFYSSAARWFLIIGSILGILSILGVSYTQLIANFLGIGRGADLYLYLSLITIFLFVGFTINRFDAMNKKISLLVKELAIVNKVQNNNKKDWAILYLKYNSWNQYTTILLHLEFHLLLSCIFYWL